MAPKPRHGAVTLPGLHFCTEHRDDVLEAPGGEGRGLDKVSPKKQEVVFFKGIWSQGQRTSATKCYGALFVSAG